MQVSLKTGKTVNVRVLCDYNRDFSHILLRNMKNMTGDLAHEGCYDPRLTGNSSPLCVYRIDFRTWLLSDTPLTRVEAEEAAALHRSRPRFLDRLIREDAESYDAELAEEEAAEQEMDSDEEDASAGEGDEEDPATAQTDGPGNERQLRTRKVGTVAVDTGQVVILDPCRTQELNANFDGSVGLAKQLGQFVVGVSTGLGDGRYPIFADIMDVSNFGTRVAAIHMFFDPAYCFADDPRHAAIIKQFEAEYLESVNGEGPAPSCTAEVQHSTSDSQT